MRNIAIWIFGLLGSGIAGALIGVGIVGAEGREAGEVAFMGLVCGLSTFACARLILTAPNSN